MTETAQGASPAESEVASNPIDAAANAFKAHLGQAEPAKPRDERGRFAPSQQEAAEQEIEAEAEGEIPEAQAESHDEEIEGEAPDEGQLDPVDLPTSWPAELAEEWNSLPAPLQDKIVQREAEREAAVNAKFQEAANVRKANEALITEANANREKFAQAADMVLSMVQPQRPSTSMLDPRSADYNPDAYHLQNADYQRTTEWLESVQQQRQHIAAQQQQEVSQAEAQYVAQVEEKFRPALLKDVPELSDPAKQGPALNKLVQYAVSQGIGEHVFTDPEIANRITSPELHMAWKAMKYDEMMSAKAKVTPKAIKPAAPAVRPGVATPRSAIKAANLKQAHDRLAASGSVEDGAAIWKNFL
jgi:hypothetical protein